MLCLSLFSYMVRAVIGPHHFKTNMVINNTSRKRILQVVINFKSNPLAILTSIINLTPILCFCACSVIVYIKDLPIISQISCWKHTAYCTQKRLKSWTKKIFTHVSNKDPESASCLCGTHWSLNAPACAFVAIYAHFCIIFSLDI